MHTHRCVRRNLKFVCMKIKPKVKILSLNLIPSFHTTHTHAKVCGFWVFDRVKENNKVIRENVKKSHIKVLTYVNVFLK